MMTSKTAIFILMIIQPIYQKYLIVETDDDPSMEEYSEHGNDYQDNSKAINCCKGDIERARRVW